MILKDKRGSCLIFLLLIILFAVVALILFLSLHPVGQEIWSRFGHLLG